MSESMPNTPNTSGTTPTGPLVASPTIEAASPSNEARTFESKSQDCVIMLTDENPDQQPSPEQGINAAEPTLPRLQRAASQGGDGTGHRDLRSEIPDSEDFPSSSPELLNVEGVVDNGLVSMSCRDGDENVHVQGSGIVMSGEQDDGKNCVSTDIQPVDSDTLMVEEKVLNSSGDVESGLAIGEDDGPGVLHTGLEPVLDNTGSMESCVERDSVSKHEGSAFSASADAPGVTDVTNLVAENETEDLGEESAVKDAEHEADNGEENNAISEISVDKEEGHQPRETSFEGSGQIVPKPAPESELRSSASSPATEAVVDQVEDIQMSNCLPSTIVEESIGQIAPTNNIDSESHNVSIQSGGKENALSTTDSSSPSVTETATQTKDTEMTEAPQSSAELNTEKSIQANDSNSIDPPSSLSQSDTNSIMTLGEAKTPSTEPSAKQNEDQHMNEVPSSPVESKNPTTVVVPKGPKQKTKATTSQPNSQTQDILLTELKAIKIANIQARTAALEAEIEAKRAKLAEVTKDLKNPAAETVKKHIKLLHDYNDIRDVGQGLVGMIADNRGVRIGEIYGEFGVDVKD